MTLVPVDLTSCPDCGALAYLFGVSQPALFLHGGYGATEHVDRRICPRCPWSLIVAVISENPRWA